MRPTDGIAELGALQLIWADTSKAAHSTTQIHTNTRRIQAASQAALQRQVRATWDSLPKDDQDNFHNLACGLTNVSQTHLPRLSHRHFKPL